MSRVAVLNRIATRAIQQLILMMNNTHMLNKPNAIVYIDDIFIYLNGHHHDVGLSGDRGDFYRRKLAEQIFLNCAIQGIDHCNVVSVVNAAIDLEKVSRLALAGELPDESVDIDYVMLDILRKIAGIDWFEFSKLITTTCSGF